MIYAQQAAEQEKPESVKAVPKGHCRKCGKYIGRGVYFHERKCTG